MTSYAVFPTLNRSLSDIYEDELYHINQNQQQSNSPKLNNISSDAELQSLLNIPELDFTSSNNNNHHHHSQQHKNYTTGNINGSAQQPHNKQMNFYNITNGVNDQNHYIQPFNEYANPDLQLNDTFEKQRTIGSSQSQIPNYPSQQVGPFGNSNVDQNDFFNINIYDYDADMNGGLVNPNQKHNFDSIPSMYLYPMDLPDEDLEDYDSEDDDDEEDKLDDIDDEFLNANQFTSNNNNNSVGPESQYGSANPSALSTPNTSVLPSPKPAVQKEPYQLHLPQNEFKNLFPQKNDAYDESAIVDEEDEDEQTIKSMDLDDSDSESEDSLYIPRFDNNPLFDKSSRSHSFVNNNNNNTNNNTNNNNNNNVVNVENESHPFFFSEGNVSSRRNSSDNTLKPVPNIVFNTSSPKFRGLSTVSSINKTKHRKSQSQPQIDFGSPPPPAPLDDVSAKSAISALADTDNQCMLTNPSTGGLCLKKFSRPYDLIRHQETIHATKKKIFRCIICESNYKKTLNNAIQSGKEDDPEKPTHSPKTFSRGDALSRHIRVKHGLTGNAVAEAIKYAKDNVEYVDIKH